MATNVQIQFNPFQQQLNILIDGKQLSEYSCLIQFADEDIWQWHSEILDALYNELQDNFLLTFIGTETDSEIMRFACEKSNYCLKYTPRLPTVNRSLQKRLGELNQLIKNQKNILCKKTIIEAKFIIPNKYQDCLEDILSVDIRNLFCEVKVEASSKEKICIENPELTYLFILSESISEGKAIADKYTLQNPIFIMCQGNANKLVEISDSCLIYEWDFQNIISGVFECFLGFPLRNALRICIQSLNDYAWMQEKVIDITTMEPKINIVLDSTVEVGKSNAIQITCDPPVKEPPKIVFNILDKTIASTNNLAIFGIKTGITEIEAYRYGSEIPFQVIKLNIIQRNRIKKIILDEDELILGIGNRKKLNFEYFPIDADNVSNVTWMSSNKKIAEINSEGLLICKASGKCKIFCTAENVSAVCTCEVYPYLENLSVALPNGENKELQLEQMQEYELQVKTYPENSIDGEWFVTSSEYNVVNIVGNKILAKNTGIANVSVTNVSKRKSVSFTVKVYKKKKKFIERFLGKHSS